MRQLRILDSVLEDARVLAQQKGWTGQEAWMANTPAIRSLLRTEFGRKGLCLKVFGLHNSFAKESPEAFCWGGTPIKEATIIQNLFAIRGVAPRVYGIVQISDSEIAQVTDFVDSTGKPEKNKAINIAEKYHITAHDLQSSERVMAKYVARDSKWIGSQMVDFGRFYFQDKEVYADRLRQHVGLYHKKPHDGKVGYQPCEELGMSGLRDIEYRRKRMGLDEVDWHGKLVLDIGCNQGAFTRLAERLGAARAVGVDQKFAQGNRDLANYTECWNADFMEALLPGQRGRIASKSGIKQFDIVFCLSVLGHAGGYAPWVPTLVKPSGLLFFEGQGRDTRETYQALLDRDFAEVEWLGWIEDHGSHPMWRCRKAG